MDCTICGTHLHPEVMSCTNCGAPTDDRAYSGERSDCGLCGGVVWSLAETCVHCLARGYPALKPRLGDKSLGAPEEEVNTS
jgi:hypothetical protein